MALEKMPEMTVKLDKMLKDKLFFFKFILLNDFYRNLTFQQCGHTGGD
jgi:hypothetical protein